MYRLEDMAEQAKIVQCVAEVAPLLPGEWQRLSFLRIFDQVGWNAELMRQVLREEGYANIPKSKSHLLAHHPYCVPGQNEEADAGGAVNLFSQDVEIHAIGRALGLTVPNRNSFPAPVRR